MSSYGNTPRECRVTLGDTPLGTNSSHETWTLDAFQRFEMPQDLTEGYGYPPLTPEIKRKILGENLARLHGVDVEAKKKEIENDEFSRLQGAGLPAPWSKAASPSA